MKSVMTIHNLKFQGVWDVKDGIRAIYRACRITILHRISWKPTKTATCLKGGIVLCRCHHYRQRYICRRDQDSRFTAEDLDGLYACQGQQPAGVLSTALTMMSTIRRQTIYIVKNYTAKNFRKEKVKNKQALQQELGLAAG